MQTAILITGAAIAACGLVLLCDAAIKAIESKLGRKLTLWEVALGVAFLATCPMLATIAFLAFLNHKPKES